MEGGEKSDRGRRGGEERDRGREEREGFGCVSHVIYCLCLFIYLFIHQPSSLFPLSPSLFLSLSHSLSHSVILHYLSLRRG